MADLAEICNKTENPPNDAHLETTLKKRRLQTDGEKNSCEEELGFLVDTAGCQAGKEKNGMTTFFVFNSYSQLVKKYSFTLKNHHPLS